MGFKRKKNRKKEIFSRFAAADREWYGRSGAGISRVSMLHNKIIIESNTKLF